MVRAYTMACGPYVIKKLGTQGTVTTVAYHELK